MKTGVSQVLSIGVLALWLAAGLGCAKAPSDAEITGQVQSRFEQDSGLSAKSLNVQAANGTVTLSGAVDSSMQRDAAARQAASVPGVKQVVNNLEVVAPAAPVAETPAAVEEKPSPAPEPRPTAEHSAADSTSAPDPGFDDSRGAKRRTGGAGSRSAGSGRDDATKTGRASEAAEGHDSFGNEPGGSVGRSDRFRDGASRAKLSGHARLSTFARGRCCDSVRL